MKLKSTFLLFAIILLSKLISAQDWSHRRYELYYGIGMVNFMGDIASPTDPDKIFWLNFFNTISPTANIGLRYQYKGRHYFKGSLFLGQLYANDIPDDPKWLYRGYKTTSFFSELSVQYELLIFKEKSRKTVFQQLGENRLKNFCIPTYLFIGFGTIFNAGNLKYYYGENVNTETFANIAPAVPIGIGFKFRFSRYTYGNLEAGLRFTFNDGLDHANGSKNPTFREDKDKYQIISINIIHKIKSNKKGLPQFRKSKNFKFQSVYPTNN